MPPETTPLVDPQGVIRDVPASQVAASIAAKWRAPTTEDTARLSGEAAQEQDYGGASGAVKAVGYGLLRGGSLGLSDVGFRALGADPQDLKGYQQQHQGLSIGSEFAGMLLPGLVAPESLIARTPAGQVSRIGRSIVSGAEARGAGVLGRAAASTTGAVAEGALYGGGQYLSQVAIDDKPLAAEGFLAAMGKGALWAAPVGGALSLGESALVRAKSLFPRSEVSKQAARAVDQEATSAIAQSVQDGDMMVAAAQRRIAQAGAAVGKAEAGERVARTMFGDAHPQAAIDQVSSGLEQQQLTQAVSDYTQSRQALADWVRAEADPDLEAALARIAAPDVQVGAPRLRSPEFGEVVPPQGDMPSMGEFGLEKTAVGKKLGQGTPGPHMPPKVPVTTEMPPLPLADTVAAPAATDSLTGQLRGMQEQLAGGADLKAMGAPSRAEYAASKAAKTEEAAAHFRAKATGSNLDEFFANLTRPKSRDAFVAQNIGRAMREEGSHAAGLAKLEKEWAATAAPGRAAGRETIPINFEAAGPRFDPKTRTYHGLSEAPPSGETSVGLDPRVSPADATGVHVPVKRATIGNLDDLSRFLGRDMSKAPEDWLAEAKAMGGQFGHSHDIAKTIVDKSIKPGMERVVEEDAIQAALRKHNGKNVDIGADLSRAAQVLSDHEAANAKLVDLLGADAPRTAVEDARAYRAAIAAQHDAAAASAAQSASDLGNKVKPAVDGGTVVDSDITKALRKHDSAADAAANRAVGSLSRKATREAAKESAAKSHSVLGIAADVGTALEVLHAMGVHTPDISAIPVIGPVLSLYLKARAVLGVIGRKGGSVGRSTESVVAAKAAAVRDRVNAAANAALDVGARALRRALPIAGPIGALGYKLFPGDGDTKSKDPRVLYQARVDEIARAQAPGAIESAIADRIRTSDPVLQGALVQKSTKLIQFLDSKRPGQGLLQSPIPGDGDWRPSKSAIEQFSRYVAAAHDPAGVLEDLAHGHPSKEGAETLQAIYPELYAQGQRALLERASQIEHTLPYARRVSISLMYQVPVDLTMSATHMQYLRPPEPMPAAAPPGAPPMGAPGITGPLQLGQQMLTSLERRAGA